jgi:transcriptional regulator with XRE-family HTH domain
MRVSTRSPQSTMSWPYLITSAMRLILMRSREARRARQSLQLDPIVSAPRPPNYAIVAATDKASYVNWVSASPRRAKPRGSRIHQVAEALGIVQQTLAHYEGGKLRVTVAQLAPVAQTLGVSVEELVNVPTRRAGARRKQRLARSPCARLPGISITERPRSLMAGGKFARAARCNHRA